MKLIKITKTGKFFRLNDNRIGSIFKSGYVRINGNDRMYQINKKVKLWYDCNDPYGYRYERVLIERECDRLKYLENFEKRNCTN
jgi:hypothetical protein|tara:strand:- start:238 stop:489 length:252 start_codon:yes stop_codon:yes gene_type:complete